MRTVFGVSPSPFVRKVRLFLAEKGLPHQIQPVLPFRAGPDFRRLSPLGLIPAYEEEGLSLADSSVICAYLERAHPTPPLMPNAARDHARALWLEEYGDSGLYPVLTLTIFRERIMMPRVFGRPSDEAAVNRALTEAMPPLFDYLEHQLTGVQEALVGERFSIADIGIATNFVNLRHAGVSPDPQRWPSLAAYVDRILGRPSFQALIDEESRWLAALARPAAGAANPGAPLT